MIENIFSNKLICFVIICFTISYTFYFNWFGFDFVDSCYNYNFYSNFNQVDYKPENMIFLT